MTGKDKISDDLEKSLLHRYSFPIKLFISAGLLWYCFSLLEIALLKQLEIRWWWVFGALVVVLADHGVGALRFKVLLDPVANCRLLTHIKYYYWSGFFNAVLPSSIGGDAMRIMWLAKHELSIKRATFYILLERMLGVITLLVIATIAAGTLILPQTFDGILPAIVNVGLGGLAILMLVGYLARKTKCLREVFGCISEALTFITISSGAVLFLLSLVYQILTVCITAFIARGIGIPLNFLDWFFIAPLLWLITLIPISVGGLGVRELGLVFFLGAYGQANEQAVVLGLLTYLTYLVAGLIGGIWYVLAPVPQSRP